MCLFFVQLFLYTLLSFQFPYLPFNLLTILPPSLLPSLSPSQWASPATCRRDNGQPRRGRYGSGLRRSQINRKVRHTHIQFTRIDRQRLSLIHRHTCTHTRRYRRTHSNIRTHIRIRWQLLSYRKNRYLAIDIFSSFLIQKLLCFLLIFIILIFLLTIFFIIFYCLGSLMREEICMPARTSLYVLFRLHVMMWFNVI